MVHIGGEYLDSSVSEKLSRENFLIWEAQILPAIRGAQLEGYLHGSTAEPAKEITTKGTDGV
jgi:hypothetical protein